MPRACPVKVHVCGQKVLGTSPLDATGLPRGGSRSLLEALLGIGPSDATGLPRGGSPSSPGEI